MSATRMWCGVLLAVTLGAAAGCSSSSDGSGQDSGPTPMGKTYMSTKVDGKPIPGGGPLTLTFQDGRITANAGCNTASGPVTLNGDVLKTDELATTLMGCPGDLADADGWANGLLRSLPTWKLDGPTLTLKGNGSTVTLQDRKVLHPDKPLTGTTWIVTTLLRPDAEVRSQALDEARPALTIAPDGSVSGGAGCNQLIGTAEVAGNEVTFHLGTTRMMCDEQVMEVERDVLQALDGKVTATVDSDNLTLRNTTNGTGLKLHAE
ncbi:META domain-containing protein [Nocardia sp. NPDC051030]|uniref:META domain-containing protein n=1 Tax=Nocardia sp. NPDC051030 TaxID=3155162 RepID=UPI00341D00D4